MRQRGSHKQFRDSSGHCATVPFHSGRDIAPTLLRQIAKDVGLTVAEFLEQRWAQPGVRADAPVRDFCLAIISAARRSTRTLGLVPTRGRRSRSVPTIATRPTRLRSLTLVCPTQMTLPRRCTRFNPSPASRVLRRARSSAARLGAGGVRAANSNSFGLNPRTVEEGWEHSLSSPLRPTPANGGAHPSIWRRSTFRRRSYTRRSAMR